MQGNEQYIEIYIKNYFWLFLSIFFHPPSWLLLFVILYGGLATIHGARGWSILLSGMLEMTLIVE
jgi:hypothetical protein